MKLLAAIFFLSMLLTACSPAVMTLSSSQNVPLLQEKGEARITAGAGTQYAGLEAAYATTNHFEIMASASYGQRFSFVFGSKETNYYGTADRFNGDLAGGYFSSVKSGIPFEFFAGVERTSINYKEDVPFNPPFYFRSDITKPFIQGDIGIQVFKGLQLALSCRAGYVIFDHYRLEHDIDTTFIKNVPNPFLRTSCPGTFIYEPAVKLKIGRQNLNLIFQSGISIPATPFYRNGPSMLYNIGLTYHFKWNDTGNEPQLSGIGRRHRLRFPFL
jgi:hypothetical protein